MEKGGEPQPRGPRGGRRRGGIPCALRGSLPQGVRHLSVRSKDNPLIVMPCDVLNNASRKTDNQKGSNDLGAGALTGCQDPRPGARNPSAARASYPFFEFFTAHKCPLW